MQNKLKKIGIFLDVQTGHLSYEKTFQFPKLRNQIILIRHGETFGNCGQITNNGEIDNEKVKLNIKNRDQRIFQGDVDTAINQLTELGKQQAMNVADKLEKECLQNNWIPDLIFHSPLSRAKETGKPFTERNGFENRYIAFEEIKEMSFGAWENRRICDLHSDHAGHLLYKDQNALVKESGLNGNGFYQQAECFSEVILRAHKMLIKLDQQYKGMKILLFTHSMFAAACYILAGLGQYVENKDYLAFDGKRSDGREYTFPHATPRLLF